jgi:pimeloyl-ACP methyl ester carboxylesterase
MTEDAVAPLTVHEVGRSEPSAQVLVLLHGVTDSGPCWASAMARWGREYRVLAPDALGHGRSPRFTPAQLAHEPGEVMYAAAEAVVERVARVSGPVVLVGHSMGGATAGAIVARRPDLVVAAVLEDPAWIEPDDGEDPALLGPQLVAGCLAARADPAAALAAGRAANPGWSDADLAPWVQAKLDADTAFLATGAVFVRDPWPALAARITRPVLVVTGTEGTIVARSMKRLEAVANPWITVEVIEGAGHSVRRDRTGAFHALVDPWIRQHLARP